MHPATPSNMQHAYRISFMVLTIAFALVGCQKAEHVEPPADELAREIKTAPKAEDAPVVDTGELDLNVPSSTCLRDKLNTDLSRLGYELVVVVDKAKRHQTAHVYQRGVEMYQWPVSTGSETPKENRKGRVSSMFTPTGFFTPTPGRLYEEYHSEAWDASMPFAIFFNGGIAIHATYPENYRLLGKRASGGCVRLELNNAKTLFELVKHDTGVGKTVKIDRHGCVVTGKDDKAIVQNGYKTLIAVINSDLN